MLTEVRQRAASRRSEGGVLWLEQGVHASWRGRGGRPVRLLGYAERYNQRDADKKKAME